MTGDPTCAHRVLTNEFAFNLGKPKRIGYCNLRKEKLPWRYNCSPSCKDYTAKDSTADLQTTLEGCGPL